MSTTQEVTNDELAKLDEETRATLQMEQIRNRTVEPGVMRLRVKRVATSEENEKVTIDVEHPVDDEIRFHLDKPSTWTTDNELVQFLDWYGLEMQHIYQLQQRSVYVEKEDSRKGWHLTRPPDVTDPIRQRARSRLYEALPPIDHKTAGVVGFAWSAIVAAIGFSLMLSGTVVNGGWLGHLAVILVATFIWGVLSVAGHIVALTASKKRERRRRR